MKRFKDYFQDKIEEEPSWFSTLKKLKKRKAELEGEAEDPGGSKERHASTEYLGDGEDANLV